MPACRDAKESDGTTETINLHGGRLSFSSEDTRAEGLLVSSIPQNPCFFVSDFNFGHGFLLWLQFSFFFSLGHRKKKSTLPDNLQHTASAVQSALLFLENTQLKSTHCICMQPLSQMNLHYGVWCLIPDGNYLLDLNFHVQHPHPTCSILYTNQNNSCPASYVIENVINSSCEPGKR